jgi:uncharacterized membrane protein
MNGYWSNLKNYTVWTLIFSLLLLFGQHYHFISNPTAYNNLVSAFLGLLVLAGVVSSPTSIKRLMAGKYSTVGSFVYDWSVLLNFTFLSALVAFVPMFLQYFGVTVDTTFYNQVALQVLVILGALHIISGSPAPTTVPTRPAPAEIIGKLAPVEVAVSAGVQTGEQRLPKSTKTYDSEFGDAAAIMSGMVRPMK